MIDWTEVSQQRNIDPDTYDEALPEPIDKIVLVTVEDQDGNRKVKNGGLVAMFFQSDTVKYQWLHNGAPYKTVAWAELPEPF